MTREEFVQVLRRESATSLAERYLSAQQVHMFHCAADYVRFCSRVSGEFGEVDSVCVVGSGNWRFSLNPEKALREFGDSSDVDVAIVSHDHYERTWDLIREFHRNSWYAIDYAQRQRLRPTGENIYAGFVSPNWIPGVRSTARFEFRRSLSRLSDPAVGHRRVNALFFRNSTEAIAYYARGFSLAKAKHSP